MKLTDYPTTTTELRVWAVEKVLSASSKILSERNVSDVIKVSETLCEYINKEDALKKRSRTSDDALADVVSQLPDFIKAALDSPLLSLESQCKCSAKEDLCPVAEVDAEEDKSKECKPPKKTK